MSVHKFKESPCLMKLKFTPELKWKTRTMAKETGRIVGSVYHRRKYLTANLLSFIRQRMRYYCLMLALPCGWYVILLPVSLIPQTNFRQPFTIIFLLLWQTFKRVTFLCFTISIFYSLNAQCQVQGEKPFRFRACFLDEKTVSLITKILVSLSTGPTIFAPIIPSYFSITFSFSNPLSVTSYWPK